MSYYADIDYFVRKIDFPNMASPGVSISNGDGTFTILINTRFPENKQKEALEHELRHLVQEHFYRDEDLIKMEKAANGETIKEVKAEYIKFFLSLEHMKHYYLSSLGKG